MLYFELMEIKQNDVTAFAKWNQDVVNSNIP